MFLQTLTVVLSLAGAVTPYPSSVKRADTTEAKLYAYGTDISGLQVYSGSDGKAYISTNASSDLDELTWPEPSMDAPWNVTMSGKVSTPGSASFYIIPSDNAFDNAGFQRANETAPDGAAMKGFFKFGSQIMFYNNGSYESKFWAQSTKVDGLYTLNWNSNNVDKEDSVPVTIKISSDS